MKAAKWEQRVLLKTFSSFCLITIYWRLFFMRAAS